MFRGTSNAHDLLTDLHCSTASFEDEPTASFADDDRGVGEGAGGVTGNVADDVNLIDNDDGIRQQQPPQQQQPPPPQQQQVHAGFLRTVKSLNATLLPRIMDLLHQPYPATSTPSPSEAAAALSSSSPPSSSPSSSSSPETRECHHTAHGLVVPAAVSLSLARGRR